MRYDSTTTFNDAINNINGMLSGGDTSSASNTAAIYQINQTLGTDTLQTTSQTVKGAINEVVGKMAEDMSSIYASIVDAVVDISYVDRSNNNTYNGTGWVYKHNNNDYIVTAAHVGQDYSTTSVFNSRYSNRIYTTIHNYNNTGKSVTLRCIPLGADSRADIMVLVPFDNTSRIQHHKSFSFGSSRNALPGSSCMVIGFAKGFDSNSCSTGVIRDNKFVFDQGVETMFVSTPGVGGNSGGPILDKNGDILGIFTFGFTNEETLGGGTAQFMLEPIVKSLIENGEQSIVSMDNAVMAIIHNTHSTYEYRKVSLGANASVIQTADIIEISGMQGINPSLPRRGIRLTNVSTPSLFQENDIVYEITYTPNSTSDPNYNNQNAVTLLIGETDVSITNITWFLNESNISTFSAKVIRNNSTITTLSGFNLTGSGTNSLDFMSEDQDNYLTNTMTSRKI